MCHHVQTILGAAGTLQKMT